MSTSPTRSLPKTSPVEIEGDVEQPLSIRDSIKSAIKESAEIDDLEDTKPVKAKKEEEFPDIEDIDPIDPPKKAKEELEDEPVDKDPIEDEPVSEEDEPGKEASAETEEDTSDEQPKKKEKIVAPDNWKTEAEWEKVPVSVQKRIAKREEEFQNGIKQYSDKAKVFDEYEQAVGPRRQAMAAIGVTPQQVVSRALEWMDALGHPDPNIKGNAFRLLAQNYGVNLASLGVAEQTGESFRVGGDVNPDMQAIIHAVRSEVSSLTQETRAQLQAVQAQREQEANHAAQAYLAEWAKEKAHFNTVKDRMGELLRSGAIPMKDGQLDLDKAYDLACYENAEVRQLQQLAKAREAKKMAEARKAKEEKARKEQIEKAKGARGSLSPNSASSPTVSSKPNGVGLSIRETIDKSIQQVRRAN